MAGVAVLRGKHCEPCIEKSKKGGVCPKCATWSPFPPLTLGGRSYSLVELAEKGAPADKILEKLAEAGVKDTLLLSPRDFKLPAPSNIAAIAVARGEIHLVSKVGLGAWLFP